MPTIPRNGIPGFTIRHNGLKKKIKNADAGLFLALLQFDGTSESQAVFSNPAIKANSYVAVVWDENSRNSAAVSELGVSYEVADGSITFTAGGISSSLLTALIYVAPNNDLVTIPSGEP